MKHEETHPTDPHAAYRDLMRSLEGARTRLAVAIAAETKATPLDRWNYYLETADQMRRCMKRLRTLSAVDIGGQKLWEEVLKTLRQVPQRTDLKLTQGEAHRLCQCLQTVLALLGQRD